MQIKAADDRTKRLRLLEDIQKSPLLSTEQKKWLESELWNLRTGIQGEQEAAHYLDSYLAKSENSVLIHDLRLVVEGETAQIDHLLITRGAGIILFETKNFNGDILINEHGEFSVRYKSGTRGIPSPLEQSRRHEYVLSRLLPTLEITPRVGSKFDFRHLVLVHPKCNITRPKREIFDTSTVIKADMFPKWHEDWVNESPGAIDVIRFLTNVRGRDTVREWGEKLVRQHRQVDQLWLPEFMQPKTQAIATPESEQACSTEASLPLPSATAAPKAEKRKLICAHCGSKIDFQVGKFCWNNEKRFGGYQYCREHQALFK